MQTTMAQLKDTVVAMLAATDVSKEDTLRLTDVKAVLTHDYNLVPLPTNRPSALVVAQYQGKDVTVRDAVKGDANYDSTKDQVVVTFADKTTKTVLRTEVTYPVATVVEVVEVAPVVPTPKTASAWTKP
jgi:hypothetical protein